MNVQFIIREDSLMTEADPQRIGQTLTRGGAGMRKG